MKKAILIFSLCLLATSILWAAENLFQSFTANSGANAITLEWRTADESGLSRFEIERAAKNSAFAKISDEQAKGYSSYYKFVDDDILLKSMIQPEKSQGSIQNKTNYSYRLKAIYSNGSVAYSNEVEVNRTINSVRRTWGMIKEMFR